MIAIADTSGLVAMFNRVEPDHRAVLRAVDSCALLVISPVVIGEVHQIASIRVNRAAADTIVDTLASRARNSRVVIADEAHLSAAVQIRRRYSSLDLDLADAVVVTVAAEYRTDVVLTLDRRDFRALRPRTGEPGFRLLPGDL